MVHNSHRPSLPRTPVFKTNLGGSATSPCGGTIRLQQQPDLQHLDRHILFNPWWSPPSVERSKDTMASVSITRLRLGCDLSESDPANLVSLASSPPVHDHPRFDAAVCCFGMAGSAFGQANAGSEPGGRRPTGCTLSHSKSAHSLPATNRMVAGSGMVPGVSLFFVGCGHAAFRNASRC